MHAEAKQHLVLSVRFGFSAGALMLRDNQMGRHAYEPSFWQGNSRAPEQAES